MTISIRSSFMKRHCINVTRISDVNEGHRGGPYLPYVCQDGRGLMTGYGTFSPNLGKLTNKKNPNEIRIFINENHEYIQTKRCNNLTKEI